MMTYSRKCQVVAKYVADSMDFFELTEFVVATLCEQMRDSIILGAYMHDYELTEQDLEELGGE